MPEIRFRKNGDKKIKTVERIYRGLDKKTCELKGGRYVRIGKEDVCIVKETIEGNKIISERPDIEYVDLVEELTEE